MNPMPASAIHRETSSGPSSIPAPSASRTSALPAWLVAARAAGVDDALGGLDRSGEAAHRTGEADDLRYSLPPDAQRGKKRGRGRGGSIALHDGLERAFRLALGQDLPIGGSAKRIAQQRSGSEPQE